MFYDETKAIYACEDDPSLIFELLKEGHIKTVDKVLSKKDFDINVCDNNGNSILMKLLKKGSYDLVLKHMKNKNFDVNHQNNEGDTFSHILASINYVNVIEIINQLKKNKNFNANIKNLKGETVLDKSINDNYIYTSLKILEDKRFNNIDIMSFKNLYDTYIKTNKYGKYTRFTNLEIIIDSLNDKSLLPSMEKLLKIIKENIEYIKEEVLNNKTTILDQSIRLVMQSV